MSPDDPEARLRRSWDANADAWTRAVEDGAIPSRRLGTDAAVLGAVLRLRPRRVLDVGCGEGWLTRALVERGVDAVGVDGSEALVARAARGPGRFRVLPYERMVGEPEALGGPYDAAVCNFSLLGEEVAPLLAALRSALAPGGRLVVQTVHPFTACGGAPYRDGWRTERFDGFSVPFPEPMPWFFRTVGSWVAALGEAGLRTEALEEPPHPETGRPLSLLLVAAPAGAAGNFTPPPA